LPSFMLLAFGEETKSFHHAQRANALLTAES
jgi:hypothetical protein